MELSNIQLLRDRRTNGLSVSAVTTIGEYLNWYKEQGEANKLPEQRPVLNTRSANTIRKRLVQDLMSGAVIPPIVVGISTNDDFSLISEESSSEFVNAHLEQGTVIDGMQRTQALLDACEGNGEIANDPLRIDFWLSSDVFSLVYRMLVLNTGQSPWDLKRQMEVVYGPMITEVERKVPGITIHRRNDMVRRKHSGEYRASSIVELFLSYTARKENLNNAEKIADDFTKLDVAQLTGSLQASDLYYKTIKMLFDFDNAISRFADQDYESIDGDSRFMNGMDLFTQESSKIGFVVAVSQEVVGKAGATERTIEVQNQKMDQIVAAFNNMLQRINEMGNDELSSFLCFDVLREKMQSFPPKNIGAQQRAFYKKSFSELIESKFDVESLNIAWQAY